MHNKVDEVFVGKVRLLSIEGERSGNDIAQIGDGGRFRQIPAEIDSSQVEACLVRATNEVAHCRHAAVDENRNAADPDRSDVTGFAAQRLDDFVVARETEVADDLLCLDFVEVMIPAQQDHGELTGSILVKRAHDGDCLDRLRQESVQERGNIFASGLVRRGDL